MARLGGDGGRHEKDDESAPAGNPTRQNPAAPCVRDVPSGGRRKE